MIVVPSCNGRVLVEATCCFFELVRQGGGFGSPSHCHGRIVRGLCGSERVPSRLIQAQCEHARHPSVKHQHTTLSSPLPPPPSQPTVLPLKCVSGCPVLIRFLHFPNTVKIPDALFLKQVRQDGIQGPD